MLVQRYAAGRWGGAEIAPYAALSLSPLTQCLHYGESIFEGFKAHRQPDGSLALFRPLDHLRRLNRSAERMCIPGIDPAQVLRRIVELVELDAEHAPPPPNALYVRPVIFADEERMLATISATFTLLVILVPVPPLFARPGGVRLRTETHHVRAAAGGTGSAKCCGNYAAALFAQREARRAGFDEVLWLDAHERRWIEETSSMNVMFVRGGALSTPPLSDTILPGITRDSLLALAPSLGIEAEERRISVEDAQWAEVSEAFSAGTGAGTAHIREIVHAGRVLFSRTEPGPVAERLAGALRDIQLGLAPDERGWRTSCGPVHGSVRAAPSGQRARR
jgi:branched-chain amino acid aminotransferase